MLRLAVALGLLPAALGAGATGPPHAARTTVVFGSDLVVSGRFDHHLAGQTVAVLAREYRESDYGTIAVVTTGDGGNWNVRVQPTIRTAYAAMSLSERTPALTIRVRPRVTLLRRSGHFVARVRSTASYTHRFVFLQRRTSGRWRTIARVGLSRKPKRFDVRIPSGISRVRLFLPRSQAGGGYSAGFSRTVVVRR